MLLVRQVLVLIVRVARRRHDEQRRLHLAPRRRRRRRVAALRPLHLRAEHQVIYLVHRDVTLVLVQLPQLLRQQLAVEVILVQFSLLTGFSRLKRLGIGWPLLRVYALTWFALWWFTVLSPRIVSFADIVVFLLRVVCMVEKLK